MQLWVSLSSHKLLSHPQGGGHCLSAAHSAGIHGKEFNSSRQESKALPQRKNPEL